MRDELLFLGASLVLLVAGANLTRYGEAIAQKTRVSVTWIGLFLVAAVTSLPELITGVSSIVLVGEPDLAAGDVFGSVMFNLLLAGIALLVLRRKITRPNDRDVYRVGAAYSIAMLLLVVLGMTAARWVRLTVLAGVASALLVVLYLLAIRHIFHVQARRHLDADPGSPLAALSTRRLALIYLANSVVVVGVATLLPTLAASIAAERGLAASFVGTAFLAASTSLPELVVTIAAIRQGIPSLAIGGLVGSNLFDLVILAIDDLLYAKGPLLAALAPAHLATVGLGALGTLALALALPAARRPRVGLALVVVATYAAALILSATLPEVSP